MIFFDELIKRVVSFPIESYDNNANNIQTFFIENDLFQLSVLTSSRSLFDDAKKSKTEKTRQSLEKYFSRAHFNPVPFGAFSSIGYLEWANKTFIPKSENTLLKVDFDNLFVSKKIVEEIKKDWKKFIYYTNPSIHFLSEEKISFYKSERKKNGDFETKYVEIDYDENIKWLVERFKNGVKIADVVKNLIEEGFEEQEIDVFLFDIIEIGVIISDAVYYPYSKPNYIGELHSHLVTKNLHSIKTTEDFKIFLQTYIQEQDTFFTEDKINSSYSHSITSFEKELGQIETSLQEKILKFIKFTTTYNGNYNPINKSLLEFGNKFYHSFRDGFIPLSTVFNPYSGLKYSSIDLKPESKLHSDILANILTASNNHIHLSRNIANNIQINNSQLPPTFSVIFELLTCKDTGKEIIYFKYIGGTSAINLLSRFDYISEKICQDISTFEKEIHTDKIIAEINAIAKPRATNLVANHQYFDYNIPLNTIYSKESNPIFLSDLYISFNGTSFVLVSEKHQKEIIPRITSAINNSLSDSEIYKFLADLQSQHNEIHHVNFNFNYYKNMTMSYIPRIYLEDDILLYPAQILIVNNNYSFEEFKVSLFRLIEKHSFSKKVSFTDDKGEIIINTENNNHIDILYSKIKKGKQIYLCECIYESFIPKVHNKSNHYSHEIIASVKNTNFKSKKIDCKILKDSSNSKQNAPILSDWLYFDLFCNSYAENELLNRIYTNIISKNEISQFFFVRYDYPESHLRVRFKTVLKSTNEVIIYEIHQLKIKNIILKYHLLPYEPETQRYGGRILMNLTENLFSLDSLDTINNITLEDINDDEIYLYSIKKIEYYLQFFNFSIDEMVNFCEKNIENFSNEFNLNSDLRKLLNKTFAEIRNTKYNLTYKDFLKNIDLEKETKKELKNSNLVKDNYIIDLIHMSLNRVFNEKQRFNEFKSYYLAKCYFNQLKFTQKNNN